jgi:hypothetical protein
MHGRRLFRQVLSGMSKNSESMKEIGVVIVGAAGDRGRSALAILPKLIEEERKHGIQLELVCVAEVKEECRVTLRGMVEALFGSGCPVVGTLSQAIPWVLRWVEQGEGRKVIVYDAAPTALHYQHLISVLQQHENRVSYFGEKPLFTNEGQIEFIERNFAERDFFCEFIETQNPVFRAARDFILAEGFRIERMSFWRASCMGVSIAAGRGRRGVEGGALQDKAPHDLSVAIGLLGPRSVKGWSVREAHPHLLALHGDAFRGRERKFLSVANTPLGDIRTHARIPEQLPAEAEVSFGVDFRLDGGVVIPASFLASWVGVQNAGPEMELTERLLGLGVGVDEWLNNEEPHVRNTGLGYRNQEVRVVVIDGLLANREAHLVLNLLAKFEGHRFMHLIGADGTREVLFEEQNGRDYHESKGADLLRVFKAVVENCAGLHAAENLSTRATLLVHKIMLNAQTKANQQVHSLDEDETYQRSLRAYRKYLQPESVH